MLSANFRNYPFFRLLVFYITGIILNLFIPIQQKLIIFILFPALLLLIAILLVQSAKNPGYYSGLINGSLFGLLFIITGYFIMNFHGYNSDRIIKSGIYKGKAQLVILENPVISNRAVKTTARILYLCEGDKITSSHLKIQIHFQKDTNSVKLIPGDNILTQITTKVIPPPFNPGEFDYRRYLNNKGIYHQAFLTHANWKYIPDSSFSFRVLAFNAQQFVLKVYRKINLKPALFGLLSALTLGNKNDTDEITRRIFTEAGVMHVMALSGFNVAIIAFALNSLLFFTHYWKYGHVFKTIIIIILIWLFAFITGFSASVTRASFMITLVLAGDLLKRRVYTLNSLFASAFVLITLRPGLITEVSFQLSFAAVLGILVFQPYLYTLIPSNNLIFRKVWSLFTVSCAAQFATMPLILFYFGQFPVYFWLTNLYVVPLVSVIICLASAFILISFIQPLAWFTGKILAFLLLILYKSVALVELLPYAVIKNIHISAFQTTLLMVIIICLSLLIGRRKIISLLVVLIAIICIQLSGIINEIKVSKQRLIMIAYLKNASVINFISGKKCLVLCDSLVQTSSPDVNYRLGKFWISHRVTKNIEIQKNLGNGIIDFAGNHVLVLCKGTESYSFDVSCCIDYLVVCGPVLPTEDLFKTLAKTKYIVLSSAVSNYYAKKWNKACSKAGIKCWEVNKLGSFQISTSPIPCRRM